MMMTRLRHPYVKLGSVRIRLS